MQFYRITPLQSQGVKYRFDLVNNGQCCAVTELWNNGQGFRILDEYIEELEPTSVVCDPSVGWGSALEQLQEVKFEFDGVSEQQKTEMRDQWKDPHQARSWLTQSNWNIVKESITIFGPMKIELVGQPIGSVMREAGRILERHRKGLL